MWLKRYKKLHNMNKRAASVRMGKLQWHQEV